MLAPLLVLLAAGSPGPMAEAERLAAQAVRLAESEPHAALAPARKALTLTAEFEPTAFVQAGRKGEVFDDQFQAAREAYRRHRSGPYEAVGAALAAVGRHDEAARYLRRAMQLDAAGGAVARLARSLVALGRGREALEALLARAGRGLTGAALAAAEQAADATGLPTLQAEIDRVRLAALPAATRPEWRDGPIAIPERARLSTGVPFRGDAAGLTLLYLGDPGCRSCSADLEALQRLAPPDARVVLMAAVRDQDQALRSIAALYKHPWPWVVGAGSAESLRLPAPGVLVLARGGFAGAVVRPPLGATLAPVLEAFRAADVKESVPRAAWNRRPVERRPGPAQPRLTEDGFAPGEDEPAPEAFARALAVYRGGRPAEALRLFETLEAEGDGWLLPPEARFDRALCLAAMGQREEARRLLLRIGDSRFQEDVDRALERVGSGPPRGRSRLAREAASR